MLVCLVGLPKTVEPLVVDYFVGYYHEKIVAMEWLLIEIKLGEGGSEF